MHEYGERAREAAAEAEASGRDLVLVEIERGLLEPAELAALVSIGAVKVDPILLERAEAARSRRRSTSHKDGQHLVKEPTETDGNRRYSCDTLRVP